MILILAYIMTGMNVFDLEALATYPSITKIISNKLLDKEFVRHFYCD